LGHKFSWNRYGISSYDCGPLVVSRDGFMPYKLAAQRIREYFSENAAELGKLQTLNQKRDFAAKSLMDSYNFQI